MGGKKRQTIGYRYYLGVHMILCHGPIDNITRIEVGKKDAWIGVSAGGAVGISQPNLFGGDEKEGGVEGILDIDMGYAAQPKNSYLMSILGALIPAYRGLVGVVLRQMYLGTSAYPKPWSFRGTRIFRSSDGALQWYPSKAAISKPDLPIPTTVSYNLGATFPFLNATNPGYPTPISNYPASLIIGPFTENRTVVAGSGGAEADDRFLLNGVLFPGSNFQYFPSGTIFAELNAGETLTVQVRNFINFNAGASGTLEAVPIGPPQPDMNPIHIIRECLTDKVWGMGYNATDIEDSVFLDTADTIFDEGLGVSLIWDKSMTIEAFIKEVLKHIDASLFVSRRTGKWNVKLVRADYDVATLLSLDPSNISSVANPNRVAFGELSNSVTVKYWDYRTGEDDSVTITDTALARIQQNQLINAAVNYPGFTHKRNAIIAAQRDLRALSIGFFSCTIICDSSAKDLNIGKEFKFTWPEWEIYDMVMRVTGISFGDGKNNKIRITASEDIYGTSTSPQVSNDGSSWVDPSQPPGEIEYQMAEEVSYFEAVQNYGQTEVDDKLTLNENIGFVLTSAARPTGAINARMWIDSGSGYEESSILDFAPFGLAPEISANDTTFSLTDFSDLDLVEIGSYAQIGVSPNCEFVRIDDIDSDTGEITVGRGCLDTTPKKFLAGESVFFLDVYNVADPTEYVNGETINVKITSITGQGEFDVTTSTPMTVTLNKRAFRPYAPGQFRINSEYYPDELPLDGSLTSTWVGRDRLQQTSSEIYDHTFGNIGPEAGVTYRFKGYLNNVLSTTVEPATSGNVWSPTTFEGLARIEVDSVRGGLYSFQTAKHEFLYTNADLQKVEDGDSIERAEVSDLFKLRED